MMSTYTKAAEAALTCAVLIAFASPLAANAASSIVSPVVPPAVPSAPPKPPPLKPKPYQYAPQNDVSTAFQYRLRILADDPKCQRFAAESDAVFFDDKMDDQAKVVLIKKIGVEAAAAGCLGP